MVNPTIDICRCIESFDRSPLVAWKDLPPWELTARAPAIVRQLLSVLDRIEYSVDGDVAIHRSVTVEAGAVLKGPLCIGPSCFVAAGAYLRGGVWVAAGCTIGPGTEVKSSFLFNGTTLAHFNFVGDAVLGSNVNLEAGSIVCNHRNERADKQIRVRVGGVLLNTGHDKFGALIGDNSRIGANAVLAPGTLLTPGTVVGRLQLLDAEDAAR